MMFSKINPFGIAIVAALLMPFLSVTPPAQAKTIYVATNGTYGNSGLDSAHPKDTITHAAQIAATGDTIQVAAGVYKGPGTANITSLTNVMITGAGQGNSILTGTSADTYTIVKIAGCTNVTFTGFTVDGGNATNDPLLPAGYPSVGTNCNGITIPPNGATPSIGINIKYNTVENVGGGGIVTGVDPNTRGYGGDYINVTGNTVINTNSTGSSNSSGISLLGCVNSDTGDTSFHNIVQTNRVCNSYNANPNSSDHTDGNGIIIDSSGQSGPPTIIQNNLVYDNSGRGIHIFNSSNVTVVNNTCYQNCRDTVLDATLSHSIGEITVVSEGLNVAVDQHVKVIDNICVSRGTVSGLQIPNYVAYNYYQSTIYAIDPTVTFSFNSWYINGNYFDGSSNPSYVTNLKQINPKFTNISTGDFSELSTSLTIDAGSTSGYAYSDFAGLVRYKGAAADLGAYEYDPNP